MAKLGKNIEVEVKADILHIAIPLKGARTASKTGKTDIVASTNGNVHVTGFPANMRLGLNLFEFKEER